MNYRELRNYENLQKAYFLGAGEYDIPILGPVKECNCENWIGWNFAKGCEDPEQHGVHFFIDDYQFDRVWRQPDVYLHMLGRFQAVCTPDFSPYADFPKAIQLYNHYRKHWLGAYWQMHGMTVIPTITWSSPDTLEWCFDGEPKNSVIALSSVGMLNSPTYKDWMLRGYDAMMQQLSPIKIFWRGTVPEELAGGDVEIVQLPVFTDKWRKPDKEAREVGEE